MESRWRFQRAPPLWKAAEKSGESDSQSVPYEEYSMYSSCRICVVEVEGMRNLQASCAC